MQKRLNILGIRGIPAAHGGFESFAAQLAPYMRDNGWTVCVYCQIDEDSDIPDGHEDQWEGIHRVHYGSKMKGPLSTIAFDWKCTLDVLRRPGTDLVLGYNTAMFTALQRLAGRKVVMNMDGIEWKRKKWGTAAKAWFWLNEWLGGQLCTIPVADHPQIAAHLATRGCKRAVVIPYGSEAVEVASIKALKPYGLKPHDYFISIARIEPENSILEVVKAFVLANTGSKLMVLGKLEPEKTPYHAEVIAAANADVIFPGAIYEAAVVQALRFYCLAYMHGHQVGGTNPSLVEALGCGNPVIAHDNRFNRWTAGEGQLFFTDIEECAAHLKHLSMDSVMRQDLSRLSREIHSERYTLPVIHKQYEDAIN